MVLPRKSEPECRHAFCGSSCGAELELRSGIVWVALPPRHLPITRGSVTDCLETPDKTVEAVVDASGADAVETSDEIIPDDSDVNLSECS